MASIDDRIVNMQFNNGQFQAGIAQTSASLKELNDNLKLNTGTSAIDSIQNASNRFTMQNMQAEVANTQGGFSVFGAVAFSVIQNLTNKVLDAGLAMGAALIDPIVNGGARRAEALQKAQFQFRGLGLDIEKTMAIAKESVLGTAFSLDQAATAAGQLGASGITAGHGLSEALKGIAGVAAQSGASFDQVAQVFEKVAGNGRLMGVELLQMSSYGINAAAVLAKAMGTTEANIRKMVSEGKISFAEFSEAMGNAFGDNAKKANELFTGALANMNAALARLGAEFEGPKLENLRDIFNAMSPLIDKVHESLMPLIDAFNLIQNSGAAAVVLALNEQFGPGLLTAIGNVVQMILALYGAVTRGFIRIFPENTAENLATISDFLIAVTAALIPSARAAGQLSRTFAGLFAIFSILGQIVSGIVNVFFDLLGVTAPAGDSFLFITARVGDFLVRVDQLLKEGKFIETFFRTLGDVLEIPIALLTALFGVIADGVDALGLFDGASSSLDDFSADVEARFGGLLDLSNALVNGLKAVAGVVVAVYNFMKPVFMAIGDVVRDAIRFVKNTLDGLSFDESIQSINTGIFAAFVLIVRGFFGNLGGVIQGNGVAFITQFKILMTSIRVNLKALEINTNAKTLVSIAIAVALLAASAIALSMVDAGKLTASLTAIGGMLAALVGTFALFAKIGGVTGIFQALALSVALTGIATAIFTLSAAVVLLSLVPVESLIAGVVALVVILAALTGAMLLLGRVAPQVLAAAIAIAIIAPALFILTGAVAVLSAIPLVNLIQGMAGLVVLLAALAGALALLSLVGPRVLLGAVAIALIAPGLTLLSGAIAVFAALPLANLIQGVAAFVVVLAAMAGAMLLLGLVGPMVLVGALAIAAVSLSMVPLVGAIAALSALPLDNLIQGMVAFGATLVLLTGMILLLGFTGPVALLGAAALVAVALAIAVLAPALVLLSAISWEGIGRLMTVLSAGLGILVVMGILLIPASVGFLLLGTAILLIGTGVMLAATGVGLLATGIGLLVGVGAAGFGVLAAGIAVFISLLPQMGLAMGLALVNMAVAIGGQAPQLVGAFVSILMAMLGAIGQVVPEIIRVATVLIVALIDALVILIPKLVNAGLKILVAILTGIANNIERIVTLALLIIANFINGLANGIPSLLQAGANLILKFINGIADTIRKNRKKFVDAALNIADAITGGLSTGLLNGVGKVISAVQNLVSKIPQKIREFLGIASPAKVIVKLMEFVGDGAVVGLDNRQGAVSAAAGNLGNAAVTGLKNSMAQIGDALSDGIDMSPTIKPVVDLSDIQNASNQIPGLLQAPRLSLETTNGVAQSVSLQEQQRNAQLVLDAERSAESSKTDITFIQNNNSPKALSTTEIYRQTKNQVSVLKGELGVVDQSGSPQ